MKINYGLLSLLLIPIIAGCGADQQLNRAKSLEKGGKYYKAWEKYQEFAADHPQHPSAAEAVFRAGWVAQRHFDDCFMASTFYDEVLNRYPDSAPWARAALLEKNNCPDYFPLVIGSSWTEVDSDTKGRNARIETICEAASGPPSLLPSQSGKLVKNFYAGPKKSLTTETEIRKDQAELLEIKPGQESESTVLLKWPIEVGTKWSTKVNGRMVNYEIASVGKKISVVAGDFAECLFVRSYGPGDSGIKNEYYAPGVGRVLTSVTSKNEEKRFTELSAYKIVDAPPFSIEDKK